MAINENQTLLASASEDRTVKVWDLASLMEPAADAGDIMPLRRFDVHTRPVIDVAFTPDGRFVASGGGDEIVRVWDVETGHEAARYHGHTEAIRTIAFTPDGQSIMTGARDGTIFRWDIRWDTWPERLCEWMQLPIDEDDWAEVMGDESYDPVCQPG